MFSIFSWEGLDWSRVKMERKSQGLEMVQLQVWQYGSWGVKGRVLFESVSASWEREVDGL